MQLGALRLQPSKRPFIMAMNATEHGEHCAVLGELPIMSRFYLLISCWNVKTLIINKSKLDQDESDFARYYQVKTFRPLKV